MDTISEFDIALARRLPIITPKNLANSSPEFVRYWRQVQKEVEQRQQPPTHLKGAYDE